MIRPNKERTYTIGEKSVTFRGRERFSVADQRFKAALVSTGVFVEETDGSLYYCGVLRAITLDGTKVDVPASGVLALQLNALANAESFELVV